MGASLQRIAQFLRDKAPEGERPSVARVVEGELPRVQKDARRVKGGFSAGGVEDIPHKGAADRP